MALVSGPALTLLAAAWSTWFSSWLVINLFRGCYSWAHDIAEEIMTPSVPLFIFSAEMDHCEGETTHQVSTTSRVRHLRGFCFVLFFFNLDYLCDVWWIRPSAAHVVSLSRTQPSCDPLKHELWWKLKHKSELNRTAESSLILLDMIYEL